LKSLAISVPLRTSPPVSELLRTSRPVTVLSLMCPPVISVAAGLNCRLGDGAAAEHDEQADHGNDVGEGDLCRGCGRAGVGAA
jgi:hypothetical protein